MCGIIGIFNAKNAKEQALHGLASVHGRGEDGDSVVSGDTWALGHRLHAIVGCYPQPFKGKGQFVANCEIYNWKQLTQQYSLNALNDAHALFLMLEAASDKDIPKVAAQLDGDFAFIYTRGSHVWFGRDIVGVKPLFYHHEGKKLAVGSERKMLATGAIELHPRTLCKFSRKSGKLTGVVRQFPPSQKEATDVMRLLEQACIKRIPDVPWGILFSGGLDSSLIAGLVAKMQREVPLYTTVISGGQLPEPKDLKQARIVAKKLRMSHRVVSVTLDQLEQELARLCSTLETNDPVKVAASITTYFAARAAHQDGLKVLLSGSGADDVFGGYARQNDQPSRAKDSISNIRKVFERDCYREDTASMAHNVEVRFPYLDTEVISCGLSTVAQHAEKKGALRALLPSLGLGKSFDNVHKIAAQYGSNADRALELLAKKRGFGKRKGAYLQSLFATETVRCAELLSGGKDSLLSLLIQHRKGYAVTCLVTIKSRNPDSYMFHTPAIEMVKLQAKALGLPLIQVLSTGKEEAEIKDLERGLQNAIRKHHVEGLIVGAIASTYQRDRVDAVAERVGLKVYSPLWHKDQELVVRELLDQGFQIILTKVAADGLGPSWLGRVLTHADLDKLKELHGKNKINIAGEGGEYESLVLDMPLFTSRIVIDQSKTVPDGLAHTLLILKAHLEKK